MSQSGLEALLTNETEHQARARLHLRPLFKVGQVWRPREPSQFGSDLWRIEVITDHPRSPVIARAECDSIRCFGLNGHEMGDEEESDLDLVTLVHDAPPAAEIRNLEVERMKAKIFEMRGHIEKSAETAGKMPLPIEASFHLSMAYEIANGILGRKEREAETLPCDVERADA